MTPQLQRRNSKSHLAPSLKMDDFWGFLDGASVRLSFRGELFVVSFLGEGDSA